MSKSLLCPLRPAASTSGLGWDNIDDADVMRDREAQVIGHAEDIEEASAIDESSTQIPVGKPETAQPTRAPTAVSDVSESLSSLPAIGALIV